MITELILKIDYDAKESLDYNIASAMHGILMEYLERHYGDAMHQDVLKPYSQTVYDMNANSFYWRICTLTKEAEEKIIQPLMKENEFCLKYKQLKLKVREKQIKYVSYEELITTYYFEKQPRVLRMEFYSPTFCHHHMDLTSACYQHTGHICHLISRNTSGYSQYNSFSL